MKITITKVTMFALIGLSHVTNGQEAYFQWAKSIGGTDHDYSNSITLDASGNIYTTGTFSGTFDFDPGVETFNLTSAGVMAIFISKFDSSGNFVWSKQFSGSNGVKAASESIAVDALGNVYTTGHIQGTYDFDPGAGTFNLNSSQRGIFISKLDNSGNFVWAKRMTGTFDAYGSSIALDASGNVYTTGYFTETCDFDPGAGTFNLTAPGSAPFNGTPPFDIYISKLDNEGNFLWAKQMGGANNEYSYSINIDQGGSGAIYTTGSFQGTVDFDPGAGEFNLIGPASAPQFPTSDIFVSKLDSEGNFLWAIKLHESAGVQGHSIVTDNFGNVYTTGNMTGAEDVDIFISKLDNLGNLVWTNTFSGTGFDYGQSVALDASGSVFVSGYFRSPSIIIGPTTLTNAGASNTSDILIAKLDNSGDFVWAKAVGGAGHDNCHSVALDASGSAYVAGYYRTPSIMFDGTTFTNANDAGTTSDIFIAKINTSIVSGNNEASSSLNVTRVFPNPANNHLTIDLGSNDKNAQVNIFDITGKLVHSEGTSNLSQIAVNTGGFLEGIYMIQIQAEGHMETRKLIISK